MTIKIFVDNSYLTELKATITAVEGEWVEFDKTIFYPLGGGQPGDTGQLITSANTLDIVDTRKGDSIDSIRHQVEVAEHNLETWQVGDKMTLSRF